MAFKTGGHKTQYIYEYEHDYQEYTLYCAVEGASDVCCYRMIDRNGNEHDILITSEDDSGHIGKFSLIDCLYFLKQGENKIFPHSAYNIIVEEMTDEEMERIYG